MMMKTNASANGLVAGMTRPNEITMPTISAPTAEPTMLPRPPMTLIAKARTRTSVSMLEPTAWLGATIDPPSPANAAPIMNTVV